MNEELDLCVVDEGEVEVNLSWFISGPLTLIFSIISTWGNIYSIRILKTLSIRRSALLFADIRKHSHCCLFAYSSADNATPIMGLAPLIADGGPHAETRLLVLLTLADPLLIVRGVALLKCVFNSTDSEVLI